MHLLTERGLNRAFIKVVEEHRRDGKPALVPADQLDPDVAAARRRIAELDAEIAALEHPFSLNETP